MKVAVIGATGFIGRHLAETCAGRGDSVTALVRSSEGRELLERKGISTVLGALDDEKALIEVCSGADVVFNLAGALGKWGNTGSDLEFVNTRAAGFVVICASLAGARRVVHASTAGVSGPLPDGFDAAESNEPHPVSDYQQTKYAGEKAALSAFEKGGIELVITRPAFVYGPGDTHKLSLFRAIAARKMILVNGGRSRLHPVFVTDAVDGLLAATERAPGRGEVYIIAGEQPASTRELHHLIAESVGVSETTCSLPSNLLLGVAAVAEVIGKAAGKEPPLTRSKVKLFSENYAYKIDKAVSELQFKPRVSLSDGIARTVDWYKSHGLLR